MKFILFVEGETEQKTVPAFLKRWLDDKLSRPVGIQPVKFQDWAEMLRKMSKKARMYLEGPMCSDILGVVGLMDLYGPSFYPDDKVSANERLGWARDYLQQQVGLEGFRMFFAVHEIEAWLLSQPDVFPREIARALSRESERPEEVNFDTPPSKLLGNLYRRTTKRTYKKIVHGTQLFRKLDPKLAAKKCPELKKMLDWMLLIARKTEE